MRQNCYCVFDSIARCFLQPFYAPIDEVALRHFVSAARDQACDIGRNPKDFTLYKIGSFDNSSGEILPLTPIQNLGIAAALIQE